VVQLSTSEDASDIGYPLLSVLKKPHNLLLMLPMLPALTAAAAAAAVPPVAGSGHVP
jgi:hypothetical protein